MNGYAIGKSSGPDFGVPNILTVVLVLTAWQIVSSLGLYNRHLFPPPTVVGAAFLQMVTNGELLTDVGDSLGRYAIGFAIGVLAGVVVGFLTGRSKVIRES